jgi:hypothetical protein
VATLGGIDMKVCAYVCIRVFGGGCIFM